VVVIRNQHCWVGEGQIDRSVLSDMLAQALCELTGERTPEAVWPRFFSAQDVIGLKLNCQAGLGLSSRVELVEAIVRGLKSAGLREDNVLAWDMTDDDLMAAGFEIREGGPGYRCFGSDHPGAGYRELALNGKVGGVLSAILTDHITALINVSVLKDHGIAGIAGCLKNHFGCIHNPNKYHPNNCDPYIADLNALPQIKDKQRLIICDATTAQYDGGPGYKPQYAVPYGAILVATDPVALDTVGAKLIADLRAAHNRPTLEEEGRPAKHIATAATYGLGVGDLDKIEVVERTV